MAAMPSHTHPLALLPRRDARANLVDHADNLMTRDAWILEPGPISFLHEHVTVTDPTGLDSDAHPVRPRVWNLSHDHFEWCSR
jgi:hypothetical protein